MPVDQYVAMCRALSRTACCKKCVVETGNGGLLLRLRCAVHATNIAITIKVGDPEKPEDI